MGGRRERGLFFYFDETKSKYLRYMTGSPGTLDTVNPLLLIVKDLRRHMLLTFLCSRLTFPLVKFPCISVTYTLFYFQGYFVCLFVFNIKK